MVVCEFIVESFLYAVPIFGRIFLFNFRIGARYWSWYDTWAVKNIRILSLLEKGSFKIDFNDQYLILRG